MLTLGGAVSTIIFFVTSYPFMIAYSALFGCFTGKLLSSYAMQKHNLVAVCLNSKQIGLLLFIFFALLYSI